MNKKKKISLLIFSIILVYMFVQINRIAQPDWFAWNNYDTTHAFYKEPKNTIETIFLGSSVTANGIIPAQLYEEQGICSYNLGTEQQPMLASYYWMQEAYRLHSQSLKTIVLDVSMLRRTPKDSYYHKALDAMHLSKVKYQAIKEQTSSFGELMSYIIPVLSYHDRWKSLTQTDFAELSYKVPLCMRGYNITTEKLIDRVSGYQNIIMPAYNVKDNSIPKVFDEQSLNYLDQMYLFSKEHNLKLVLMKTPVGTKGQLNWTDSDHLSTQKLADHYGIDFLDFNYKPLIDQLGYDHANDSREGIHLNYYGAAKFTSWFGNYLTEQCGNTNVRGDTRYAFMENELVDYHRKCAEIEMESQTAETASSSKVQGNMTQVKTQGNSAQTASTPNNADEEKTYKNLPPSYNSLLFFVSLLIFLTVYFLLRRQKAREFWILAGNVAFYLWAGWAVFVIVTVTSMIVYLAALCMGDIYCGFERKKKNLTPKEQTVLLSAYKKSTRNYLGFGMVLILLVWICVKVGKLWGLPTVYTFQDWFMGRGILVPLGISYYTLSAIGYLLDVFWRKTKPERNFICLFTVMTYFPHMVQGPISKYSQLIPQFKSLPGFDYERVCFGFQRMLWGYIKKIVIADRLVVYTSAVFSDLAQYAGVEILLAVVLSIFQLYADFSGCMDIVCGISEMIGVKLEENFRQPLFARSASEFWTRWHMTLGGWTKEYIYLPIAMNPRFMKWTRKLKKNGKTWFSSFVKAFAPLIAVWLFTGFWHGTGWDYMAWGMYWCILMTLAKETKPICDKILNYVQIDTQRKYYTMWQSVRTCLLFGIGRMFTVTGSLAGCAFLWKQLWSGARLWVLFDGSLYQHGLDRKDFYVAFIGIILLLFVDILHERGIGICRAIAAQPVFIRWLLYYGAIFAVVVFGYYGPGYLASNFVYGAF